MSGGGAFQPEDAAAAAAYLVTELDETPRTDPRRVARLAAAIMGAHEVGLSQAEERVAKAREERAAAIVNLAHAKACLGHRPMPAHAEHRGETCAMCSDLLGAKSGCALQRTRSEESTLDPRAREICGIYHRPCEYPGLFEAEADRWIAIVSHCDSSAAKAREEGRLFGFEQGKTHARDLMIPQAREEGREERQ